MLNVVKVQQVKVSKLYGIDITDIIYTNVERIIFDKQFKDEEHKEEPCFIIVMKVWNERGYEERKTATFWCEDTQIIIERE